MSTNMLFTCVGRRNYLINYFKEALNNQGKIFASDVDVNAPAMIDADVALVVPNIYDASYIPTIINLIKTHNINAVISLNDFELPILSKHKKSIETQTGAKIIISSEAVIDKLKTANFLKNIGLNTPKTFDSLELAISEIKKENLTFPLVVKDRWGSASMNINYAENIEELELIYKYLYLRLKNSTNALANKDETNIPIIIQEKIIGKEYGIDILNDFEGNYVGTFVREKLNMRSGETDRAVSVIDEKFNDLGKIISTHLKHYGNLDCDVFVSNNKIYVLELNPRFGGGYPFSHEAGINIAAIYIEWINNRINISKFNNYKSEVMYSKCDRMLKNSR